MNKRNNNATTGNSIIIKGAKVNNLKNIDVQIPRNSFTVITGLSGSGKSSLAFDTLYAEGQRRYVESLSSYARQFLGRISKPECEYIHGLPPAIAIEQKVNTSNSRSTVGTSTEINDYLRLLFARIGKTISPVSGKIVKKHTVEDILNDLKTFPASTRFALLSPIQPTNERTIIEQLSVYLKEGFSRIEQNGEFIDITDYLANNPENQLEINLLIDRFSYNSDNDTISRIYDSAETAFFEGHDRCIVKAWLPGGEIKTIEYSKRFEADGILFSEPSELIFNFNSPLGACPNCEGFGKVMGIDEDLVVPNKALSVYQDAVVCWRGESMSKWKSYFIRTAGAKGFPIHRPYCDLTQSEKDLLWHGKGNIEGIDHFFKWIESKNYSIQYRVLHARYRGKTICPVCHGSRLKPEAEYVKVCGKSISELTRMPIKDLREWFSSITLSENDLQIASRMLLEIRKRLDLLCEIGLDYLTLNRVSSTLSGGESQRINLVTSLGSSLVGSLYILDEPSIGLHSRDTSRLITILKMLQRIGNTVIVVEHDEDIIRQADYLIDIGPKAGRLGGEVVYQGEFTKLKGATASYTRKYLDGELTIPVPSRRRKWNNYIEIIGATEHNLKDINVRFPLGVMTVVTGVSGSGKSTLVRDILYKALARRYEKEFETPGAYRELRGDLSALQNVEMIDQNPIGKSTRSNPATYLKAFNEIRNLYADQPLAKQLDITPGYFSFNTPGGRCEECKGNGTITVEMQFMADIELECDACHGKRYKQEVLDILYRGKSIADVLDMTVNEAIEFFSKGNGSTEKRIVRRLQPLQDVGLGYIKLGQSSSTLSGGENQRVKLAYYIGEEKTVPTLFIFDEPTTGLHFHDINKLLEAFRRLVDAGHTLLIIEHNMDVIKCADHIIDIGPEGGDKGGSLVACGTPEEIVKQNNGYTARYLAQKL